MHSPAACASCTMRNVKEWLQNVSEALQKRYGALRDVTELYGTVTENIDFAHL